MYRIQGADQQTYGPVSADVIRQWIRERRLNAQSLVWPPGATQWVALGQLPEFQPALFPAELGSVRPLLPAESRPGPPAPASSNPMAMIGLILGFLSLFPFFCCCSGFPFNVLGLVFSLLGLAQARKDPLREPGQGAAVAGLILSAISLLLALFFSLLGGLLNLEEILRNLRP